MSKLARYRFASGRGVLVLLITICALAAIGGCSQGAVLQHGPPATTASDALDLTVTAPTPEKARSVSRVDPTRLIAGPGVGRFIPLTNPEFVSAAEAAFLSSSEIVLGLSEGDEHRAYPVRQIAFHHIVNDEVQGQPYLVTY